MAYEILESFNDRRLKRYIDKAKERVYPETDDRVDEEWLEYLSTNKNSCCRPFIRKVDEEAKKAEEANRPDEDIDALKAEADALGVEYHPNIGRDKLLARLQEAKEAVAKAAAE